MQIWAYVIALLLGVLLLYVMVASQRIFSFVLMPLDLMIFFALLIILLRFINYVVYFPLLFRTKMNLGDMLTLKTTRSKQLYDIIPGGWPFLIMSNNHFLINLNEKKIALFPKNVQGSVVFLKHLEKVCKYLSYLAFLSFVLFLISALLKFNRP